MHLLRKESDLSLGATQIITRSSSSTELISEPDIQQVLSDALLSFSPLATLVGADSARALAHRVTNFKQSFVASIAPIGALSMMATACKGANLPGIKDMLGVGDEDITDAARATGCGTIIGNAVPRMDKQGGLSSTGQRQEDAACAIVRLNWRTAYAEEESLKFVELQRVVSTFTAGTMSGRVFWELDSEEKVIGMIQKLQRILVLSGIGSGSRAFVAADSLPDGVGTIELHWPAPAMPLETNVIVIYLYGGFLMFSFISVAAFVCSPLLSWQSPLSSILLLGGQALLALGHVAVRYIVQCQRETLHVQIPNYGLGKYWMMIDKPRFTSSLALRPYSFSSLHQGYIILSQHYRLKSKFVKRWHALLTLTALVIGFISFYVGGKSSDVRTVLIYIGLFVLANVLKGPVVLSANKPSTLHFVNEDKPDDSRVYEEDVNEDRPDNSGAHEEDAVDLVNSVHPKLFRIYLKLSMQSPGSMGLFYFPSSYDWMIAAKVISNVVNPVFEYHGNVNNREEQLHIPLYLWHRTKNGGDAEFHGLLLLAIKKIKLDALFETLGMEFAMILADGYDPLTCLRPESTESVKISFLAGLVYACTHLLLSEQIYCAKMQLPRWGVHSLKSAIDHLANSDNLDLYNDTSPLISELNAAAELAKKADGVKLSTQQYKPVEDEESKLMRNEEIRMRIEELDERLQWFSQFNQIIESRLNGLKKSEQQELTELKVLLEGEHVDLLLHELLKKWKNVPSWLQPPKVLESIPSPLALLIVLVTLPVVILLTVFTLALPVSLQLPLQLLWQWQFIWTLLWQQWWHTGQQAPLWWMDEQLRLQLATAQLAMKQSGISLHVEELYTERKVFENLSQRLKQVQLHLQIQQDTLQMQLEEQETRVQS